MFEREIRDAARDHDLEESLVWAVCKKESNLQTWAVRFERQWAYPLHESKIIEFSRKNSITKDTERILGQMSFGLMQVMGTVARELGFEGHLTQLLHPEIGLEYGCKKLKSLIDRPNYSLSDAIAAYNAGIPKILNNRYVNQQYVDDVLRLQRLFSEEELPEE